LAGVGVRWVFAAGPLRSSDQRLQIYALSAESG
jgi:hypothetical protein